MYLEGVSSGAASAPAVGGNGHHQTEAGRVFETWKDWPPSQISHHGGMCCEVAREWIISMDYSAMGGGSCSFTGPRWLRQKFKWGASSFPIHWCEVVKRKKLDCGVHAALAAEVFQARGVRTFRAQFVQEFTEVATTQWCHSWAGGDALPWTKKDLIYHEGCAIATDGNSIKVWDPSAGWWVDPKASSGYGAVLAVRISGDNLPEDLYLDWGKFKLAAGEWVQLKP